MFYVIVNPNSIVQFVIQVNSTCVCENSKYLKGISDTSVIKRDEIIIVVNNVSIKKTIVANVTSTDLINCHRLLYFTHIYICNHVTIDNYYYLLSLCKTERYGIKWKIMN